MAVTPATLIESKYAENSQTTQYTSTNVKTLIDKFTVTNATAAAATFAVNLVVSAGTAAAGNVNLSRPILAGKSDQCPELVGHALEPGGFISTLAGTASALVIRASGRQVS